MGQTVPSHNCPAARVAVALVLLAPLSLSVVACSGSNSAAAPVAGNGQPFSEADFRTLARLFWTELSDDGQSVRLSVATQSYLDENGAYIDEHDVRHIFRHRGEVFCLAYVALRQEPEYKARFDRVEHEVVSTIPDGASEAIGHKIAYNALLKSGLLQLIVDRAGPSTITIPPDELADPDIWGREDLPILRGPGTVWKGPKSALQFHCCNGAVVVSEMSGELERYTKAYHWLEQNDASFAATLKKTVKPYDDEAKGIAPPLNRRGVEQCDDITMRLRASLNDAGVLKAIDKQASQHADNVAAKR
jgi:hypothetical protein